MKSFQKYYEKYGKMYPAAFTDIALIESLDEKFSATVLSPNEYHHVLGSIGVTQQNVGLLHFCLSSLRDHGLSVEAMYEVLLQIHLFLSFPAMIEALRMAHQICPLPHEMKDAGRAGGKDFFASGEKLCRELYGEHFHSLVRFTDRLHPALTPWMMEHGYGRVLSRQSLAPHNRENAILPVLMITGYDRQLTAHARGYLNLGGKRAVVWNILDIVELFISSSRSKRIAAILRKLD